MPRSATTGPTIGFRLPLDKDAAFREEAIAAGMSPGQYAAQVICDRLSPSARAEPAPPTRPAVNGTACRHLRTITGSTGIRRCHDCPAIRGVDGVWRT